jgi:cytochrome d ubiquinol oxidase subunit II
LILPATYPPIIAMLLGLIFRGVAFEFRWRDPRHEQFWDFAFFGGSLVAALSQGIVLGALLQGIAVEGRSYAGGTTDWLSPYSLLTGVGVGRRLRSAWRDLPCNEGHRTRRGPCLPPRDERPASRPCC